MDDFIAPEQGLVCPDRKNGPNVSLPTPTIVATVLETKGWSLKDGIRRRLTLKSS